MATYKTPDVYIEEVSTLPPSVAEIETAVPAFIGHTEKSMFNGMDLSGKPTRINSLMEYHECFGGEPPFLIEKITIDENKLVSDVKRKQWYHLYDSLRLFFLNGGGACYIVSVGGYMKEFSKDEPDNSEKITQRKLMDGLDTIKKVDEVTLILFPDATGLDDGIYSLQQAALKQCDELMDRFVIMDLIESKIKDLIIPNMLQRQAVSVM